MIQKFQKTEQMPIISHEDKASTMKDFLTENFQMPDEDSQRIFNFIGQDNNLETIMMELPDMIRREVAYDRLLLEFSDELHLEVSIVTSLDVASSLRIENKLERQLYDFYEWDSCDKVLLMMQWKIRVSDNWASVYFTTLQTDYIFSKIGYGE